MPVQSVSAWILDHYTCACAVFEPMSILFASLQCVGGLLASMEKLRSARRASTPPCVGSISLLNH